MQASARGFDLLDAFDSIKQNNTTAAGTGGSPAEEGTTPLDEKPEASDEPRLLIGAPSLGPKI